MEQTNEEKGLGVQVCHRHCGPECVVDYETASKGVIFVENNLFGMKDQQGMVVVNPEYLLIAQRTGSVYFLKPNGGCKIYYPRGYQTLSISEDELPYVVDGKVGYKCDGKVIIPTEYEYLECIGGNKLFLVKKDGRWHYLDDNGRVVLPSFTEGDEPVEIFLSSNELDDVISSRYVGHPQPENENVVYVYDQWVELERFDSRKIMNMLVDEKDDLALTSDNLALMTNNFSYEYSLYFAQSNSRKPLHECLEQLKEMPVFDNSWYYVVKIWQSPGEHIESKEFRYFCNKLKKTDMLGELTIAVGCDESLKPGEVRMMFLTHYHERCFPAVFEFEWNAKCNNSPIVQLMEAIPELKQTVADKILEQYREEVYDDQLLPILETVKYYSEQTWEEAEKALNFFLQEGSPNRRTLVNVLAEALKSIKRSRYDAVRFYLKVASWSIGNMTDINCEKAGKTPLDYLALISSQKTNDEITSMVSDLNEVLVKNGGKIFRQISLEKNSNTDYFKELEYMRLKKSSFKVMPGLSLYKK